MVPEIDVLGLILALDYVDRAWIALPMPNCDVSR